MAHGPDALVEAEGEPADLEYVADYEIDADGQPSNVQLETERTKVIPSQPSEEDVVRAGGRLPTGALRLTVPSELDVGGERGGRRDRFYIPPEDAAQESTLYQVVEVRSDQNAMTGTEKQTVMVERLGGYE